MVDHDAVDFVRDVLEGIHDTLQILEDFASHRELERIGPSGLESAPEAQGMDLVGLAFKAHHAGRSGCATSPRWH